MIKIYGNLFRQLIKIENSSNISDAFIFNFELHLIKLY